jgi:hypothetical protein
MADNALFKLARDGRAIEADDVAFWQPDPMIFW